MHAMQLITNVGYWGKSIEAAANWAKIFFFVSYFSPFRCKNRIFHPLHARIDWFLQVFSPLWVFPHVIIGSAFLPEFHVRRQGIFADFINISTFFFLCFFFFLIHTCWSLSPFPCKNLILCPLFFLTERVDRILLSDSRAFGWLHSSYFQ